MNACNLLTIIDADHQTFLESTMCVVDEQMWVKWSNLSISLYLKQNKTRFHLFVYHRIGAFPNNKTQKVDHLKHKSV